MEAKETWPPPRYNEGTLVDAMQNAWRFVADETLRERLKQAKGIGTPATRAEVIRSLKAQELLVADGKHIVPTQRGLVLHGVLEQADPALVDPGVTAQMKCLLDDVLVGRQDMMSAIDTVCGQASRIIGRLTEHGAAAPIPMASDPAPNRSQRSPPSSQPSRSVQPKAASSRSRAKSARDPSAVAGTPTIIRGAAKRRHPPSPTTPLTKAPNSTRTQAAPDETTPRARRKKAPVSSGHSAEPLPAIMAQALGARYRAGGWYAPANVALTTFRERGWL